MSDTTDPLDECRDELRSVQEENELLRASANAFGDLAERLRASLERERRMNALHAPLDTHPSTGDEMSSHVEEEMTPRNHPPPENPKS